MDDTDLQDVESARAVLASVAAWSKLSGEGVAIATFAATRRTSGRFRGAGSAGQLQALAQELTAPIKARRSTLYARSRGSAERLWRTPMMWPTGKRALGSFTKRSTRSVASTCW